MPSAAVHILLSEIENGKRAELDLLSLQVKCKHKWDEEKPTSVYVPDEYAADPRCGTYLVAPSHTKTVWHRTCLICNLTQKVRK